nr:hypothetical protein [uncultured Flavobacterium sp.]
MKKCINCNDLIEIKVNFCPQCGTKQIIQAESNFTTTIGVKNKKWVNEKLGLQIKNDKLFFIDSRDKKEYPLFITDKTIWFAKNLAVEKGKFNITNNEFLYANISDNKDKLIPKGWLIPNIADWNNLSSFIAKKTYNYHPLINKHTIISYEHTFPYDIVKCKKEDEEYLREGNLYQLVDINKDNHVMVFDITNNIIVEHNFGGATYFDPKLFNHVFSWHPGIYNPPFKSKTVRDLSFINDGYIIVNNYFGLNYDYSSFYIDSGVNNYLQLFDEKPLTVSKTDMKLSIRCFIPITSELISELEELEFKYPDYINSEEIQDFPGITDETYNILCNFKWVSSQYR